jgi:hypothetical protein
MTRFSRRARRCYRRYSRRRSRFVRLPGARPSPALAAVAGLVAAAAMSAGTATTVAVPQHRHHHSRAAAAHSPAASRGLGERMAAGQGWTGAQWQCLDWLWTRESGWSNTADTRRTGAGGDGPSSAVFAYGIAQARPWSKMPRPAWPPGEGGSANPRAQIRWGLGYIGSTYRTPCAAWQHETVDGWY